MRPLSNLFAAYEVSTHSRLKAAGSGAMSGIAAVIKVSTHSRLKAAGGGFFLKANHEQVSTHSRLKAAGIQPSQVLHH